MQGRSSDTAAAGHRRVITAEFMKMVDADRPDVGLVMAVADGGPADDAERRRLERLQRDRGEAFYSDLLFALTHTYFPHEVSRELWEGVLQHRAELAGQVGRDLGLAAAAADYLGNLRGVLPKPALISAGKLAVVAEIALKDELTGLYDRAAFITKLRAEAERFDRYGDSYSVVMIDLDDFKRVNDQHGHSAGDQVLHGVASILLDAVRSTDVAARYGGEEFVILAPRTNHTDAHALAERIRARVERRGPRLCSVTASMGVATCPDHARSSVWLLRVADEALYHAKRAGKNRVASAMPPPLQRRSRTFTTPTSA